ncbi:MAG: protein DpdE [Chloroflexota bacterium]|nr:protein DpdE [Chloroflexota bacterium]
MWTFDQYGIGQISSIEHDICTVRFFKSVSDEVEVVYALSKLGRAYLSPQTRAYHRDENGIWSVGRIVDYVVDNHQLSYYVRFPNGRELTIGESDIRVRCLQPVDDPASVLAAGGMESQFLHDKRRSAIECLTSGRSAGFGVPALLSASVELAHHQVDVVRRVLNDPIQRYLLADEVGLGKTIEACAIVRQAMWDNPAERVVVIVPSTLIGQWKRELSWRFFLEPSGDRLRVIPYEEITSIDPSEVDTFVVDEAQNLITDDHETSVAYNAMKEIARHAPRLLLLSATPVLGNERTLLALLHLLDPVTYRLDDEAAFLQKLAKRQDFGRLLLTVKPDQNPVFLRMSLRSLRELVPGDELAESLVTRIEQSMDENDQVAVSVAVREFHRHISDTYRLHQRLLRTRRRDLSNQESIARLALAPMLEEDEDERTPSMVMALDQWRVLSLAALAAMPGNSADDFEQEMARRYLRLHEALGMSLEACGEELKLQLRSIESSQVQSFQDDRSALEFALQILDEPSEFTRSGFAVTVIAQALQKIAAAVRFPRLVVFGSSAAFIQELVARLQTERVANVFVVTGDSAEEESVAAIDGFFSSRGPSVICCDSRGEEGLNLQYAHGIVHLDLPVAPTRIEQRIGRLDRFGRELLPDRAIYHWVVSPYADYVHPWQAWFELLRDDFEIFDQSISEVQFLLDELQEEIILGLYRNGTEGISALGPRVRNAVWQERERLDEQYALDSRSLFSPEDVDAFHSIVCRDNHEHYQALHLWLTEVLHFSEEWLEEFPGARAFRLHWTSRTLVPKQPWQELFPEGFLATPMTYERQAASRRRGLRLVRPGLELVDSLEKMLQWDDRGTAYSTWRMEPDWPGETRGVWLGFRLVFVVEANFEAAQEVLGNASIPESLPISLPGLKRRLDSLLPPWTAHLYVDIQMQPVSDPFLLDVLGRPYTTDPDASGRRDFNLGSRRNALYDTIGFEELFSACNRVQQEAEAQLRASRQFTSMVNGRVQNALAELDVTRRSLERRGYFILEERGGTASGLEADLLVNAAVTAGITSPTVRLDSIGLIIVADGPPRVDD